MANAPCTPVRSLVTGTRGSICFGHLSTITSLLMPGVPETRAVVLAEDDTEPVALS
jgi:hypothetical protein